MKTIPTFLLAISMFCAGAYFSGNLIPKAAAQQQQEQPIPRSWGTLRSGQMNPDFLYLEDSSGTIRVYSLAMHSVVYTVTRR